MRKIPLLGGDKGVGSFYDANPPRLRHPSEEGIVLGN